MTSGNYFLASSILIHYVGIERRRLTALKAVLPVWWRGLGNWKVASGMAAPRNGFVAAFGDGVIARLANGPSALKEGSVRHRGETMLVFRRPPPQLRR